MIADPQTVTINAVPIVLNKTTSAANLGEFSNADRTTKLVVSHSYGKRIRRMFRIDHSKLVADPLYPAQNIRSGMSFYIVADVPDIGYTVVEQKQVVDGFITALNASSGALLTEFLGGES